MHDKTVSIPAQKNLFRGKSVKTGKMVFGNLISVPSANYFCILPKPEDLHPMDVPYLDGEIGTIDGCAVQVYLHTVGQFTGLFDKNGKRIFEGDIIRTSKYGKVLNDYNSNGEDTFCVVYRPALFRLEREKPPRGFNLVDDGFSKMEVIGNIHDNPELLGGGLK